MKFPALAATFSLFACVALTQATVAPSNGQVHDALGNTALSWVPNAGQWDAKAAYRAQSFAGSVWVTTDGQIVHQFNGSQLDASRAKSASERGLRDRQHAARAPGWVLSERFVGGRLAQAVQGRESSAGRASFMVGETARHAANLPTFERLDLGEVFPGITVDLRASGNNVEKLFTVSPRRDPGVIAMHVDGAQALTLADDGRLIARTGNGDIAFTAPVAFQEISGLRRNVEVAYTLDAGRHQYGFRVGSYDRNAPLVIDPVLQSTFVGGSGGELITAIAIAPDSGDVYVAGETLSTNFPGAAGGAQPTIGNAATSDAFVVRFNAALTVRRQSTYYGGGGQDRVTALGIHPFNGDVYLAGFTFNTVPGTLGGAQPAFGGGGSDGFIARFSADLTTLSRATYLGGSAADSIYALAVHPLLGSVYVAGFTDSTDFPGTSGAAQAASAGGSDAFVAVLNPNLTTLVRSTYLGGSNSDGAQALAIHPTTYQVYVAGSTLSSAASAINFPGVSGGAQASSAGSGGNGDAFVSRLNANLTTLHQSTFFGGAGNDVAYAIAFHRELDRVFITGSTTSASIPNTVGAAQTGLGGGIDAFVASFNAPLTSLLRSTYLGGSGNETAYAVAVGPGTNDLFVVGETQSSDLPGVVGAIRPTYSGGSKAFAVRIDPSLGSFVQTTYLGGSVDEHGYAVAVHPASGEVYVGGDTSSSNFPRVAGGAQSAIGGGTRDGFVARLSPDLKAALRVCLADVDGDGSFNMLTDGVLIIRMMLGLTGTAVTNGAIGPAATRPTWSDISANLTAYCGSVAQCFPQVDGSTPVQASTDGVMFARALAGFTGNAVTSGALGANPTRAIWPQIRGYLNANCGTSFAP